MSRGLRRPGPALIVACIALFAALGGSVYAAGKIDGHALKMKSLPGNRLAMGSVPGNRLQAGAIPGNRIAPGSLTGNQIDPATLGQVPSAVHADSADSARDAETALVAVTAHDAKSINGRAAGCRGESRFFAGACWQLKSSETPLNATAAALACANQGGELPGALELVAFSQQQGVGIAPGDEWTGDIASFTVANAYSLATVTPTAEVKVAASTATRKFRCVIPLVS